MGLYACRYAIGEFGGGPVLTSGSVLLSILSIGLAYPVDRLTDYPRAARADAHSVLFGQPLKTSEGFDAHVAAISEGNFEAADNPASAPYVEIVVEQESQLLPIAIVDFSM